MRHVLIQADLDFGRRHRREAIRNIHEPDAEIDRHLRGLVVARAAHAFTCRVGPERQRPADGGVRFRGGSVHVFLRVGEEPGLRPLGVDQSGEVLRDLLRGGGDEPVVVGIRRGWQRPVIGRLKPRLAAIAMADAVPVAAIVGRRLARGVEEQAVDVVPFQRFAQNFEGLLAVIRAVDARRVEAVVSGRFAVGFPEEPVAVRVIDRLRHFAEIEASDDADLVGMRFLQHLAEHIVPGREVRAHVMRWHLTREMRGDAPHPYAAARSPESPLTVGPGASG